VSGNTASDVTISDGVIKVFNDMKVHKSLTLEVKKCKKARLFCLNENKKNTILEESKEIWGICGRYATKQGPHYALYDATKNKKEDLVFIF
ncbi:hypothetical protein A6R68_04770, partial [Neotoma lepida]